MEGKFIMEAIFYYLKDLFDKFVIKMFFSYFVSTLLLVIGDFPDAYQLLVALIFLDLFTGLMKAMKCKNVSLRKSSQGIVKIFLYSITIAVGVLMDRGLFGKIPPFGFSYIITAYLMVNTAISVVKNLRCLGVPIPRGILTYLEDKLEELDKCPPR